LSVFFFLSDLDFLDLSVDFLVDFDLEEERLFLVLDLDEEQNNKNNKEKKKKKKMNWREKWLKKKAFHSHFMHHFLPRQKKKEKKNAFFFVPFPFGSLCPRKTTVRRLAEKRNHLVLKKIIIKNNNKYMHS
jgi:hypothetical protein